MISASSAPRLVGVAGALLRGAGGAADASTPWSARATGVAIVARFVTVVAAADTDVVSGGGGAAGATTIAESLSDDTILVPDEFVAEAASREYVGDLLATVCNDRERDVLGMRFGLYGNAPISKTKIAERLAVSRERVRQIEVRALSKLRQTHRANRNEEYARSR
mmetsp:Transcript_14809/g.51125  ORF Transcript_14809/g.51125 Transcript_14809/m.51125 type:complete len:165 (-) Transcript_14809:52-546(-)